MRTFSRAMRTNTVCLAAALTLTACSDVTQPAIVQIFPLQQSTAVPLDSEITITFADTVELQPKARDVVLYDITRGAKQTVAGQVIWEDTTLHYKPDAPLELDRTYRLIIERDAFLAEKLLDADASEIPEEPITWPFALHFSTQSSPRVRAVYYLAETSALHVRFSQPMEPISTSAQFALTDANKQFAQMGTPIWLDDRSARFDLPAPLDAQGFYTLQVRPEAQATDGNRLDTDGDGRGGREKDTFTTQFTGIQKIVTSRLKTTD